MPTGKPALIEFIREHIHRDGPVTFRWFMEQALYHPEHGYYASGRAAIGRHGDYFTNVSVGPLFGKLLAMQFREMWLRMGTPDSFTIVEQGANSGDFARDVLGALKKNAPDFFESVHYTIVEPFPVLRERQKRALEDFPRSAWCENLAELQPFRGVHFSNELVDAMPVHLVLHQGGVWRERYVDFCDGEFVFIEGPLSSARLELHLQKLPPISAEKYTAEINLDALDWIALLSSRLTAGYVLAVDYGHPRSALYNEEHSTGTLSCYAKHRRNFDPLQAVGEADVTAHVDFTSLAEHAEAHGFRRPASFHGRPRQTGIPRC
jgi:SAM-dependent MidA family methyltransferase